MIPRESATLNVQGRICGANNEKAGRSSVPPTSSLPGTHTSTPSSGVMEIQISQLGHCQIDFRRAQVVNERAMAERPWQREAEQTIAMPNPIGDRPGRETFIKCRMPETQIRCPQQPK